MREKLLNMTMKILLNSEKHHIDQNWNYDKLLLNVLKMLCEDEKKLNEWNIVFNLCINDEFWESNVKRFIIDSRRKDTIDSSRRQREKSIQFQDEINVFNSVWNQF